MNIPAGYQLHVTTWENDGDAYKTQILSGLNEADVRFFLEVCEQFRSKWSSKDRKGHGNQGNTRAELIEIVEPVFMKHKDGLSATIHDNWEDGIKEDKSNEEADESCECIIYELLVDLLAYPVEELYRYDYRNFTRVFERFEVFYLPGEIQDVTAKFK